VILFYRECADLLRAAGAEHRNALVVNTSSLSGKSGQAWLNVYSATKAAVIGWTQAMNKELNSDGIKSVALCPGFVDTDMTEFIREHIAPEDMIRTEDVAEAVRFLLKTSPQCVVPEIVFQRPGEAAL
jgi:NAD(P)-dependent dehydrogenase (short-subunit alcohol dehydrogenase family)